LKDVVHLQEKFFAMVEWGNSFTTDSDRNERINVRTPTGTQKHNQERTPNYYSWAGGSL